MNYWQGEHIRLRAVEPSDAESFHAWNQDSERNNHLDFLWPPNSLESVRKWLSEEAVRTPTDDHITWVIENMQGEAVGSIDTHHCTPRAGTFMYGVSVAEEHRCKGYAREAILMVLRYFFEELRYQKCTISVHSNNAPCIHLHERLGYQQEGRLRRTVYTGGAYHDEIFFGITAEEFAQRYGRGAQ